MAFSISFNLNLTFQKWKCRTDFFLFARMWLNQKIRQRINEQKNSVKIRKKNTIFKLFAPMQLLIMWIRRKNIKWNDSIIIRRWSNKQNTKWLITCFFCELLLFDVMRWFCVGIDMLAPKHTRFNRQKNSKDEPFQPVNERRKKMRIIRCQQTAVANWQCADIE